MSCIQTLTGIASDCQSNRGGVKAVYAINTPDIASITVTAGAVTAMTLAQDADGFVKYAFRKGAANATISSDINDANGTKSFNTDLVVNFNHMETAKRTALMALSNSETMVVFEDNNNRKWILGRENPVTVTSLGGETGSAFADANQYSITLNDNSSELPLEVTMSDTDWEALLAV